MDYGQSVNNPEKESFFTAGVGNVPENLNPNQAESLNSGAYSPERDPRSVGNTAIFSSNSEPIPQEQLETGKIPGIEEIPELGQIATLEMPPNTDVAENGTKAINISEVARENDRIAPKTLKLMEKAESDFNRDAMSPAEFYDFKSDATVAYMETFGAQANWKGK